MYLLSIPTAQRTSKHTTMLRKTRNWTWNWDKERG